MVALAAAVVLVVTGTAQQGQRLSVPSTPGTVYQWYRCAPDASHCLSVHGAKGASYTLGAKDVGKTLGLTAHPAGGASSYAAAVGPIAAPAAKLVSTVQPTVTGDAIVGKPLTVGNGTWSKTPKGYTYDWLRCNGNGRICISIAGATQAAYTPTAVDVGHTLEARVTASAGTTAQPALSTTTAAVLAASGPVATVPPAVTGTAQGGQRLSVATGTWTGSGAVTFAYQWYRCDAQVSHCSSIHGATAAGYRLGTKDVGATVALTLKATDAVATVPVFLPAVGPIAASSAVAVSTGQPKVSGTTTLTVDNGAWKTAPAAFTYAWLRCNANGRLCVPIAGATKPTYVPAADDEGHSLVATVNGALSISAPSYRGEPGTGRTSRG
jgi:hypothetical protein